MTANEQGGWWLVLVVRVPAEPSRHRVAVWRELRRAGAVPLGQGCWVVPEVPAVAGGVARAVELAGRGSGEVVALRAAGRDEADAARLEQPGPQGAGHPAKLLVGSPFRRAAPIPDAVRLGS